jgi:hypothetical protein
MGLAKHNPGGQWRLGLSATAASAVLYSAIVLFGVGSASPSALDAARDPHASAVLVLPHADTVSGSVQRLPQASPEPRRHYSPAKVNRPRAGVAPAPASSAPSATGSPKPASPRQESATSSGAKGSSPPASVVEPAPTFTVTAPIVPVPPVTVTVPELPVQLPTLPAPPALPLPPTLP